MRLKNRQNILFLFLGFIMLILVGCSNNPSATDDLTTRLYMISGETGSLEPATDSNEYIITLHNVPYEERWIMDRPGRKSGIDTTGNFIGNVWPVLFDVTAPNAILKFLMENENGGLFLRLKSPAYDAIKRTLSFTATLLRSTYEEGDPRLLETMEFEYPVIVILNNGDGFNFVVHSETATIANPGDANTFTIIQDNIDDEVLWASGAPSTISKVTTTEELANKWEAIFSGAPPNAFIFGITGNGQPKAYSITLESMESSPGDISISYPASILDNDPIENVTLNSVTLVIDNDAATTGQRQINVNNQVPLHSPCSGPSLTFFQGYTPIDVAYDKQKSILVSQLFGEYQIGFQVNGWYWRCGGASNCPNPKNCRNPDNAGQVAIKITPGQSSTSCTAAVLVKNFDIGRCDSSVPNASNVLTVTLEDKSTCLVKVEVSDLTQLDPTYDCCSCENCKDPHVPPGQEKYCN